MKFISWNVNGLRACASKGFADSFRQLDADFFCLQETKMQEGQLDMEFEGYRSYWNYAEKKGYSGTAVFTKHEPVNVTYGIGIGDKCPFLSYFASTLMSATIVSAIITLYRHSLKNV